MKLRVAVIDHVSDLGGAELSMEALLSGMPAAACEFQVILPGGGPLSKRLAARGIAVEFVRLESWRWWVKRQRERWKFFVTIPLQAVSLCRWICALRRL